MRKISLATLAVVFLGFSAFTFMVSKQWKIAEGYEIRFKGKYAEGTFDKLNGNIFFDPFEPGSASFDVTVDVTSINTGKDLKNKHAVSDKWFDAEKYPVIRFVSSQVSKADSTFMVSGELTLHGVTKEITIPFTFTEESSKGVFRGTFKVNRGEFGIGRSTGKDSDFTTVDITVPVIGL